jgi:hypothetical protein
MTRRCPSCNSSRIESDGEYVEPMLNSELAPGFGTYVQWFTCTDCGRQWSDSHAEESGDDDCISFTAFFAGAVVILALVAMSLMVLVYFA